MPAAVAIGTLLLFGSLGVAFLVALADGGLVTWTGLTDAFARVTRDVSLQAAFESLVEFTFEVVLVVLGAMLGG